MKNKFFLISYFCIFSGLSAFSKNISEESSSKDSIQLNEVVVTGTRFQSDLRQLPMSVSIIDSSQIHNAYSPSLLPVITEEVPGLFVTGRGVMGYGVANGAAGGINIRGVGGTPTTGVLVLIDGHPQYMGLMGHPLADAYQSMMAERVEVIRGPASILYGSNAIGGVVNIITPKITQDEIKTNAQLMYGSYNTFSAEADNRIHSGKFSSFISLNYNTTDGHRDNMDFSQLTGYAKLGYQFNDRWRLFADVNITNFDASNPGSVSSPVIDNDADITRGMASFSLDNNSEQTSGSLKLFYNWGSHSINDGYKVGGIPSDSLFRSNDYMLGITWYQSYRFFKGNETTAGIDYQRFGGHVWYEFPDKKRDVVSKDINDIAGYINIQQLLGTRISLNAGIRIDYNDYTGMEWVPQTGITYSASEYTVLKAIISKGFRNPTIREMYMFPPQNPDLKPESLINYEISASQYLLKNDLYFGLNFYYIDGKNSIQTVPVNGKPLNVNTGKIENYGLEFSTHYNITPSLRISGNYSWLHMKYKVTGAPEHKLYGAIAYNRKKWNISTGLQYINHLYTSVLPTETAGNFTLWNIRAAYRPVKLIELFVKGENLLNQDYEINKGYPMPGTTVFGGISIHF